MRFRSLFVAIVLSLLFTSVVFGEIKKVAYVEVNAASIKRLQIKCKAAVDEIEKKVDGTFVGLISVKRAIGVTALIFFKAQNPGKVIKAKVIKKLGLEVKFLRSNLTTAVLTAYDKDPETMINWIEKNNLFSPQYNAMDYLMVCMNDGNVDIDGVFDGSGVNKTYTEQILYVSDSGLKDKILQFNRD